MKAQNIRGQQNGKKVWVRRKKDGRIVRAYETLAPVRPTRMAVQRQTTNTSRRSAQPPQYILTDVEEVSALEQLGSRAVPIVIACVLTAMGLFASGLKLSPPYNLLPLFIFGAVVISGVIGLIFLALMVWHWHKRQQSLHSDFVIIDEEEEEYDNNGAARMAANSPGQAVNAPSFTRSNQNNVQGVANNNTLALNANQSAGIQPLAAMPPQRLPTLAEQITQQVNSGEMAVYLVDEDISTEISTWDIITRHIEQQRELAQQNNNNVAQQQLPPSKGQ